MAMAGVLGALWRSHQAVGVNTRDLLRAPTVGECQPSHDGSPVVCAGWLVAPGICLQALSPQRELSGIQPLQRPRADRHRATCPP